MQSKNFLFERSELNSQLSTMLFKKRGISQIELPNVSQNLLSQFNLSNRQQLGDSNSNANNSNSLFTTPPMPKKIVSTPKAPIKLKKLRKKADLKPKKLEYSEDEIDITDTADSGVYVHSDVALFCKQHTINCSRFNPTHKQARRLRIKLDKIKTQPNDKENDSSVIENRSENPSTSRNNVAQESSVVYNSKAEVLSQCDNNLNWKEKLHWLQLRRDIGLWIECCNKKCKKLRYVEDYHDPVDVPKKWYCKMNTDNTMASCNIPAQSMSHAIASDLIENAYNAGSIVWARVSGYPWWPGIVNDCPETFTYYKLPKDSNKPIAYCVTFFSENQLEYAWVTKSNIKPFATNKHSQLNKRTQFLGINYETSLNRAYEVALNALPLTLLQRLQKFSFLALYEKFDANNNFRAATPDEIIPCSYPEKNSITLKEYYLNIISRQKDTQ